MLLNEWMNEQNTDSDSLRDSKMIQASLSLPYNPHVLSFCLIPSSQNFLDIPDFSYLCAFHLVFLFLLVSYLENAFMS